MNIVLFLAVTIGISVGVAAIIFLLFGILGFTFYRKIRTRYVEK
jgi:ABC-type lipoprotein release transport system permease subunit